MNRKAAAVAGFSVLTGIVSASTMSDAPTKTVTETLIVTYTPMQLIATKTIYESVSSSVSSSTPLITTVPAEHSDQSRQFKKIEQLIPSNSWSETTEGGNSSQTQNSEEESEERKEQDKAKAEEEEGEEEQEEQREQKVEEEEEEEEEEYDDLFDFSDKEDSHENVQSEREDQDTNEENKPQIGYNSNYFSERLKFSKEKSVAKDENEEASGQTEWDRGDSTSSREPDSTVNQEIPVEHSFPSPYDQEDQRKYVHTEFAAPSKDVLIGQPDPQPKNHPDGINNGESKFKFGNSSKPGNLDGEYTKAFRGNESIAFERDRELDGSHTEANDPIKHQKSRTSLRDKLFGSKSDSVQSSGFSQFEARKIKLHVTLLLVLVVIGMTVFL